MATPYGLIVAKVLLVLLVLPHGVGAGPASAATGQSRPVENSDGGQEGLLESFALSAEHGPVEISAKLLEFDNRSHVLTYRGGVTVTQADVTLHTDVLRVTLDPEVPERPREIIAEGAVRIAKGDRRATGGRAVFDQTSRTIVLSDHAVLQDGPNQIVGERVVIYLDEDRSVVEGGGDRVRALLYPPESAPDTPEASTESEYEP